MHQSLSETPPIAAQTLGRNHRPRKKPRRSDPTSSPPSLSDGRLPQKAFQSQSLNRPKTPYPGRYNLVTIGVLEFVVVIDVYAQPTRKKIKFYRTASDSDNSDILTTTNEADASLVGPLLVEIDDLVSTVLAHGAYDGEPTWWTIFDRHPDA